jgi:carbon-monoxide dehydrogenase medium subunit
MKPAPFDHIHPETPRVVAAALSDSSKIMAGGQSLGPMLNLRLARPSTIIGLSRIPGLCEIREKDGTLSLGAGVTHARIEDGDSSIELPSLLRYVARGIAYRAVRNKGTVGGSLAHADPAADWITAMTAIGAHVVALAGNGAERRIAMPQFMLGAYRTALAPTELITAVEVPASMRGACWGYYKVCRKVGEFADAIGAFVVHPPSGYVRLVAGATGAKPVMLTELAAQVARTAQAPGERSIKDALAAALPEADDVKLQLLSVALRRAIEKVIPA